MKKATILSAVFLISLSIFMFEITLTRLFSALMFYHFVFLAVSMAILCLGIGGIWVYKIRNQNKVLYGFNKNNILERSSLLFGLSAIAVTLIIYKTPFFPAAFLLYLLLGTVPFILGGMFISEAFYRFSSKSLLVYFADLIGSGLGSILIIRLLDNFSIITTVLIMSLIGFSAHILVSSQWKTLFKVTAILVLIILVMSTGQFIDQATADFTAYTGDAKTLGSLTGDPKSIFTSWNSFARTDVIETNDRKEKIVLVDGSAASKMIPFDGNLDSIAHLKKEIGYLAFSHGENSNALLIGPGGGMDLLLARLAGIKDITAVEINKGTIEAARELASFNGNIYDLPGTKTLVQDGRSFISTDKNKYDVIYLSMVMTQSAETLGYALSENYIYTLEAFTEYLNHLEPDGKLALVLHGKSDLQKAIATAIKALERKGLTKEEAVNSIAYINSNNEHSGHQSDVFYPLLIVKNRPFTEGEAKELLELTSLGNNEIIHLPYFQVDNSLTTNLNKWVVTDNSPFFYNSLGNSIPITIWFVFIAVFLIGNRALQTYREKLLAPVNKPFYHYFLLLGLGFMLIEIPIIQKFVLFLGHPTLTFSIVIATLLTSGGLGSLIASLIKRVSPVVPAGFIFLYSLLLSPLLSKVFSYWQGDILQIKILVTILILTPLGLALGIPFPSGLQLLQNNAEQKELIPLMWGVNGWTSVLGSIIALMIAMAFGYNWALILGSIIYLLFILNYLKFMNISPSSRT